VKIPKSGCPSIFTIYRYFFIFFPEALRVKFFSEALRVKIPKSGCPSIFTIYRYYVMTC